MINVVFVQSMAELLAENYHNIWARKKKTELEAKGKCNTTHLQTVFFSLFHNYQPYCSHHQMKQSMDQCVSVNCGHNGLTLCEYKANHDEKQFVCTDLN